MRGISSIMFLWGGLLFFSCSSNAQDIPVIDCQSQAITIQHSFLFGPPLTHWRRTVELPLTGRFAEEAHYVCTTDSFPEGRLFANTLEENILAHLQRSLELYRRYDPEASLEQLYGAVHQKVWTAAEMGHIGQGSIGERQVRELIPEKEMWLFTMMWDRGDKPTAGTKFLVSANGRSVVVVAGYETGPGQEIYLGGLSTEAHHWLGTNHRSEIRLSYLTDQEVTVGPVICEEAAEH